MVLGYVYEGSFITLAGSTQNTMPHRNARENIESALFRFGFWFYILKTKTMDFFFWQTMTNFIMFDNENVVFDVFLRFSCKI